MTRATFARIAAALVVTQLLTLAVEIAALGSMGSLGDMLLCVCEDYPSAIAGLTKHLVRHRLALGLIAGAAAHGLPLVLAVRHRGSPRRLSRVARLQVVLSLAASLMLVSAWLLLVTELVRAYHATSCFCSRG